MVALHGGPVTPYEVQLEREVIQEEMVRLQAQTVSASLQNMLKIPSGHPVATLVPYDHAVIVPLFNYSTHHCQVSCMQQLEAKKQERDRPHSHCTHIRDPAWHNLPPNTH